MKMQITLELAILLHKEEQYLMKASLYKHFLSCLFFLPHSLLCYKPLIYLMSDKGQKQKLVEIRAREVREVRRQLSPEDHQLLKNNRRALCSITLRLLK